MYSQVLYSYRADDMAAINEEIGWVKENVVIYLCSSLKVQMTEATVNQSKLG